MKQFRGTSIHKIYFKVINFFLQSYQEISKLVTGVVRKNSLANKGKVEILNNIKMIRPETSILCRPIDIRFTCLTS